MGIVIVLHNGFQEKHKVLNDPSCSLVLGVWKYFARWDNQDLLKFRMKPFGVTSGRPQHNGLDSSNTPSEVYCPS